ncbi:MAG: lysyl-tRNA synthetase, class, partial [Micromonosporaceae bacterium]|nr:lysyl-tRNA synthetase, class [Micromonosporaceae bacterium]
MASDTTARTTSAGQVRPRQPRHKSRRVISRVPDALATLFAVIAWLCALLALVPLLRNRTEPVRVAAEYLSIPIRPNLAYAAFVGLIAASLRRRTRISWWIVVLFYFGPSFVASLVSSITEPPLLISAAILFVLLGFTFAARREFSARLEPGNGWRALGMLVGGLAIAVGLAIALVWAFPGSLVSREDRIDFAVNHVLGGLGTAMLLAIQGRPSGVVTFLCGLFGALAFLAAAWVLFRPRRTHAYLDVDQERGIRRLLAESGERDSLGYFATRRDKAAIFSESGKAAVTYRVEFGTSIASGDPIGDPEAWPQAIEAWLREAESYAWTPGVLGASEDGALAYQRAGLDVLQIGDEAIVETAEFAMDGRAMRGVRQAVRRIEKSGYTSRIRRHAELSADEMARVLARADEWRDTQTERGFSMALGRLGDPVDGQCVLVEAIDADGELRAVLSFVPWGKRGLSLDLMRRDRQSDNGIVEFMVVGLIHASRTLGVDRISLNFAMFREVFEEGGRIGAGPFIRLARSVLVFFSRWWQLESLYRSNAKYQPVWEPRMLCYRSSRDLPRISVAMGIAEGFVRVPSVGALLRRGRERGAAPEVVATTADLSTMEPADTAGAVEAPARPEQPYPDLPEQMRVRRLKLDRLRREGVDPYPVDFVRSATAAQVRAAHPDLAPDTRTGAKVAVAGRVVLNRPTGKLCFATIQDGTGRIQLMLSADRVGPEALARWLREVDLGDHVGVRGEVVTSRRGELSVAAEDWMLTAKCLRPLPDKHRGLTDAEARVRLRHVDLITNPAARDILRMRS